MLSGEVVEKPALTRADFSESGCEASESPTQPMRQQHQPRHIGFEDLADENVTEDLVPAQD